MKRLLLPLLAALALPTAVNANVDPEVHNLCLRAVDYQGCVNAHSGKSNAMEIFNNPGTATSKGNSFPYGYAYIGQGYCAEVICKMGGKNNPLLAGKKWKCTPRWGETRANLEPGPKVRIGIDNKCPMDEPKYGWSNTCESPYVEPIKADRIEGRRNYTSGY